MLALALAAALTGTATVPPTIASSDAITQQAYIKASNTDAFDAFGSRVAVSGTTIAIAAYGEDSRAKGVNGDEADNSASGSGAVYVFTRSGSSWIQEAYLKPSNTGYEDAFGASLALDGDTLVVGATLEDSAATTIDGNGADNTADAAGAAYVFVRSGSTWTQQAYLKPSNAQAGDLFGASVDVDGDTVVVGAPNEDSSATGVGGDATNNAAVRSGAAYVFVRSGSTWTQQAYLKASNTDPDDGFGSGVQVDGDTVAVGAKGEDSSAEGIDGDASDNSAPNAGAVYVFARAGTTWSQQAYVKPSNTSFNDIFGASLALSGDLLAIGATGDSSLATGIGGDPLAWGADFSGAVHVFERAGTTWAQDAYLKASNTGAYDQFGIALALDGERLLVGAEGESSRAAGIDGIQSNDGAQSAGAAYLFVRTASSWSQQAYLKASNSSEFDQFGIDVGIDGDTLVVGAPGEDSASVGVGGIQLDENAEDAGAAYAFDVDFWRAVPGCFGNTATIAEPQGVARIGSIVPVAVSGATVGSGILATYFGALGTDGSGCGTPLGAGEELLLQLAPFPRALALAPLVGGNGTAPFPIPNQAVLVGLRLTVQSVLLDTTTFHAEFSSALEFAVRP
ncbi:hypothetical protein Pla163_37790 [Planctomycetes bacterium Pla163]|uniref:FG-GAP repeat protein n=1 Tax=Rohdeia mirabilis TaxID=2528008 RepID=A0A518D581_9BACT|nr:hypothetical protein Pla163_37790 [Planctomycetes bacterium Pla163]